MESLDNVSKRFKTLPLNKIDSKKIGLQIQKEWREASDNRADFLQKREEWTAAWRDLNPTDVGGPWDNSSNFHVPMILFYGKAIHARLWQLFSSADFFGVKARKEVYAEKEPVVKEFMQYILLEYANGKKGSKAVFDEYTWDNVFDGSGYLKNYWQVDKHKYVDVEPVANVVEKTVFDEANLTGKTTYETTYEERDVVKEELIETPFIKRVLMDDILMPQGQSDPQTSDFVTHRVYMTEWDLKSRAMEGKFDYDAVEDVLKHKYQSTELADNLKRSRSEMEGYSDWDGYYKEYHVVLERYGRVYVKQEIDGDESQNIDEIPEEAVVWVHQATGKVLGWTYLYRISPSGMRPIFKSDFIHFPDRTHGVGVGEALYSINRGVNSVYNLRMDNGVLASSPFGFYRASSGLKPDKIKTEPGVFYPIDDPGADVRVIQMPYLNGFGYQEEDRLMGYSERLMNISDLQIRGSTEKVGLFRTASGANAVQNESGIQLEIHFDRMARCLSDLLKNLFILTRERMPETLYYRLTGENGEPIFGKVNREDLKGNYDFEINIDVLSESKIEAQQKAVMMMQTLINPAFTQTGVITPDNLYHLAKNFLVKNKVRKIDNFLTPPPQYKGEMVTPSERVFRIVINNFKEPPVEDTVRMDENHEAALKHYEGFKQSDHYGLLVSPEQVQALERVIAKHQQFMTAIQAGGNPNMTGMQVPREGFAPMEAAQPNAMPSQGTLGTPTGESNGPVV